MNVVPRFAGYSDVAEIGRGGQARIYRAFNDRLSRFEAVKIYTAASDDPQATKTARDRFDAEARITGQINNPHVIVVHRSEPHDGVPCLFMEHIDGPSLRAVIDDPDTALSLAQIVAIARDIADALDHLAAMPTPVVHRDVKPDNILLEHDGLGGFRRAVLADFGVAVRMTGSQPESDSAGTPAYMAPEQLLRKPATPRSDQYGLASTIYELLVGQPPFAQTSGFDRVLAIAARQDTYPQPSEADRRLRLADRVFQTALAANPDRRYPSAKAFVENLAIAVGVTESNRRDKTLAVARRHPGRAAAALIAAVAALAVGGVGAHRLLSDLRTTVHPVLAQPGMYSTCPDLLGQGFSADPRHGLDTDRGLSDDQVTVLGTSGAFQVQTSTPEDPYPTGATFHLSPDAIMPARSLSEILTHGLPSTADCRYVEDPDTPPNGAVLNVYTGAANPTAIDLGSESGLRRELMLVEPRNVTVGLGADHKTEFPLWGVSRPPYDICLTQLTGHDRADIDPLLILHQDRDLEPSACEKLEQLVSGQLTAAWSTSPPGSVQPPGPTVSRPAISDDDLWAMLNAGTQPCDDHSALGLSLGGPMSSPTLGEGCWQKTGSNRRVALFQASPQSTIDYFDDPYLEIDGVPVHGALASNWSTIQPLVPGDGTLPTVWMESWPSEFDGLPGQYAGYYLNALRYRAIGNIRTPW